MNPELLARATDWMAADPDAADRATIAQLVRDEQDDELARRFDAPLRFGTAGLRGPVMAGPAGMNRLTVRRATQGVVAWLRGGAADPGRGVVVGRDARRGSEAFNDEVVAVLLGAGVPVWEMPGPLPTPLCAYAVRALGAAAGIMVTASHNPPGDNGYKLYGPSGAQIIPPDDALVEAAMREPGPAVLGERRAASHHYVPEEVLAGYRSHLVERFGAPSELAIAYTPLHGVGGATMTRLFEEAGFHRVSVVAEQFAPDGAFPTLPFPNPEEPGALDLALATGERTGSTLVIANDPDADRLGAAVRTAEGWRVLRGDEIGWLLGASLVAHAGPGDVVATTIVSSSMLGAIAAAAGVRYVETLTGFKWIARAAGDARLAFGYEEALGYAVDPAVADKDGLSAALALARLADDLAREGRTLVDRLDELEARYGVHAGAQVTVRVAGDDATARIAATVARLLSDPPRVLGGVAVERVDDLSRGWRGLAPTSGLRLDLGATGRVVVRPSGTEAKLKAYLEVVGAPGPLEGLAERRARARRTLEDVRADLAARLDV